MIVAVIGKGGAGKTTVASLLLRRLLDDGEQPVLCIDADPSSCLGAALGVHPGGTLGALRESMREAGGRPASMSHAEWLALKAEEAIVESRGFDLLTMGRPEGPGCYCFVNNLIRDHLDRLGRAYRHVLVDCEAGLEHLSRRTAGRVDRLVCVTSRARMAAETVRRALGLFRELHGDVWPSVDLVLNGFEPGEPHAAAIADLAGGQGPRFARTLVVPHDPEVTVFERDGRSLLDLDPAGPARRAILAWRVTA
jgi:CO dehydrogenase maturation factor